MRAKVSRLLVPAAAVLLSASSFTSANVLWGNGPFVTGANNGFGGAGTSAIAGTTFGPGAQNTNSTGLIDNRVADNFIVPAGPGWNVTSVTVYTYQTQANQNPPLSTITGAFAGIYNTIPVGRNDPPAFGDYSTPRPFTSTWTGAYRVTSTTLTDNTRAIFAVEIDLSGLNITLAPGTYWLGWNLSGSGSSGPWAVPVTPPAGASGSSTRDAMQATTTVTTWAPLFDAGLPNLDQQYDLAFLINGSVVPEPTSLGLIALGGVLLLGRRRTH